MYDKAFYLMQKRGNNAFAWEIRSHNKAMPRLYVPERRKGSFEDLKLGNKIAFSDFDGFLRECTGLEAFIETNWEGVPSIIVDNHNHVFYFWYEAMEKGLLQRGATLIHIDQHKDMRSAPVAYVHKDLNSAFQYTNEFLNVGNYIRPAIEEGLLKNVQFVTGNLALEDESYFEQGNKILNIDLDYFVPELDIDFQKAKIFIWKHLEKASFVSIATSPFFIDQAYALELLKWLLLKPSQRKSLPRYLHE